jgi:hypothetical protein
MAISANRRKTWNWSAIFAHEFTNGGHSLGSDGAQYDNAQTEVRSRSSQARCFYESSARRVRCTARSLDRVRDLDVLRPLRAGRIAGPVRGCSCWKRMVGGAVWGRILARGRGLVALAVKMGQCSFRVEPSQVRPNGTGSIPSGSRRRIERRNTKCRPRAVLHRRPLSGGSPCQFPAIGPLHCCTSSDASPASDPRVRSDGRVRLGCDFDGLACLPQSARQGFLGDRRRAPGRLECDAFNPLPFE